MRALESAAGGDGVVRAAAGWTDLVVTPRRGVRAVDGLPAGLHEAGASHLLVQEAIAGRGTLRRDTPGRWTTGTSGTSPGTPVFCCPLPDKPLTLRITAATFRERRGGPM